ncbi:MAG TPA: hypothetical protein VN654_17665 [Vicinamibacterales bacterium]|nr:hypothetical protein [Vicinamibacterales bacterium]
MSDNLNHFLIDLASDADRMAAFTADPAAALAASRLTNEERAAVLSRDSARVRAALGFSLAMAEPVAVTHKRPTINPPGKRKTDDAPEPVATKQRKPASKKKTPASRKGGRKSSKKK